QPVLDTIVRTAVTICDSYDAVILLKDGEQLRLAAHHGPMKIDFGEAPISRHREHPPIRGGAAAHAGAVRITGTADRNLRRLACHFKFADRHSACARNYW